MADVERSITVPTPIDRVFSYLTDFTNSPEWDPGSVKTERTSGDGGVGTIYHNTSEFVGKRTELDYVVKELVPNERFVMRGENETVTTIDTMTFTGDATSTTVTYHADFELKGAAKLAAPAMPAALKKLGDDTAQLLEEKLTAL